MRAICMFLCFAVMGSAAACGLVKPAETPSHDNETPTDASVADAGNDAVSTDAEAPARPTPTTPKPAPPKPVATPTPSATTEAPAEPAASVPYDKEAVEIVLKRAARQVKGNCGGATDEEGKATGPWGKTTVTVKLGRNGHSQGATVPAPFDGSRVGKCITRAFAILIFPPFAGTSTNVDWPVEVVQPGTAPTP